MNSTVEIGEVVGAVNSLIHWTVRYIVQWDKYSVDPPVCISTPVAPDLEYRIFSPLSELCPVNEIPKIDGSLFEPPCSDQVQCLLRCRNNDLAVYDIDWWMETLKLCENTGGLGYEDNVMPDYVHHIERCYYTPRKSKIQQLIFNCIDEE